MQTKTWRRGGVKQKNRWTFSHAITASILQQFSPLETHFWTPATERRRLQEFEASRSAAFLPLFIKKQGAISVFIFLRRIFALVLRSVVATGGSKPAHRGCGCNSVSDSIHYEANRWWMSSSPPREPTNSLREGFSRSAVGQRWHAKMTCEKTRQLNIIFFDRLRSRSTNLPRLTKLSGGIDWRQRPARCWLLSRRTESITRLHGRCVDVWHTSLLWIFCSVWGLRTGLSTATRQHLVLRRIAAMLCYIFLLKLWRKKTTKTSKI